MDKWCIDRQNTCNHGIVFHYKSEVSLTNEMIVSVCCWTTFSNHVQLHVFVLPYIMEQRWLLKFTNSWINFNRPIGLTFQYHQFRRMAEESVVTETWKQVLLKPLRWYYVCVLWSRILDPWGTLTNCSLGKRCFHNQAFICFSGCCCIICICPCYYTNCSNHYHCTFIPFNSRCERFILFRHFNYFLFTLYGLLCSGCGLFEILKFLNSLIRWSKKIVYNWLCFLSPHGSLQWEYVMDLLMKYWEVGFTCCCWCNCLGRIYRFADAGISTVVCIIGQIFICSLFYFIWKSFGKVVLAVIGVDVKLIRKILFNYSPLIKELYRIYEIFIGALKLDLQFLTAALFVSKIDNFHVDCIGYLFIYSLVSILWIHHCINLLCIQLDILSNCHLLWCTKGMALGYDHFCTLLSSIPSLFHLD